MSACENEIKCRICQGPHSSKECTKCRKCKEEGHKAIECPNRGPARCFNCDEEGHVSNDCTKPKKCFNCYEEGRCLGNFGNFKND